MKSWSEALKRRQQYKDDTVARILVRARTLDLLGRQQMASIPNALHELYKNAHDAYADNAVADYYRADGILTLRDDGVGMTEEDFCDRWLTIGTESKVQDGSMPPPYKDPRKAFRHALGAKGIGRLAIASIGPQVLILSRAERDDGLQEMVVSFINWVFFEIPGLNLDAVDIPLLTVPVGSLPDARDLQTLVERVRNNLSVLTSQNADYQIRIEEGLAVFSTAIPKIVALVRDMPLATARGSAFLILPVDPVLDRDMEEGSDGLPAPLLKILRGFANTMMPRSAPPPMIPAFYVHEIDGSERELIGEGTFFLPEEFLMAHQHIEGEFDEYGQFTGTVALYHQAAQPYTVPWDGAHGKPSLCGGFRIAFAYLQGNANESSVPPEQHKPLSEKLNLFGGLYVYRDGVRILPYGNSDFDWLNIERRRTKSAQDWYFSYRRLFGAVEISSENNANLVEKAGREGFRENLAYRQFRDMLENLFKQLAYDWFRGDGTRYGNFREKLKEYYNNAILLKKQEEKLKVKRVKFKHALDAFFENIEQKVPEHEVKELRLKLQADLSQAEELSPENAALALLRLEGDMTGRLRELRNTYRIPYPRGLNLTPALRADMVRSREIYDRLEKEWFSPLEEDIRSEVSRIARATKSLLTHRKRIRQALELRNKEDTSRARNFVREARDGSEKLRQEVVQRSSKSLNLLAETFNTALAELQRQPLAEMDEDAVDSFRQELEARLTNRVTAEMEGLERLSEQVRATLTAVQTGISAEETTAAAMERSEALEEQLERYTELAQLGTAIGIIQHEFHSAVEGIRHGLRVLGREASSSPELVEVSRNLRANFEHLDGYLALFTPLNRRLYRKPLELTGKLIREYLLQIFEQRFKRHHILLKVTEAFETHTVTAFPATFLPAFVNIVDNAIFWLTRDSTGLKLEPTGNRIIQFDADDRGFLIGNNGPGIEQRDAERIFELSFTRKLRGRGMGLAVARKALNNEGYELSLEACGKHIHPVFRVGTERQESESATKE